MRLNACFTSLFIVLSVLWWAALRLAHLLNIHLLVLGFLGAALAALLLGLGLHVRQCIANGHSLACTHQLGQLSQVKHYQK